MSTKIITTNDLIEYLKIKDFNNKSNQEVLIKKITQQATFPEELMPFRDFGLAYKEIDIPQTLYLDGNNKAFLRYSFNSNIDVFYKPFSFAPNSDLYTEAQIGNLLTEISIPDELYRGLYSFYINEEDQIVASVEVVSLSNLSNYIAYQASSFSFIKEYQNLEYEYTNAYGASAKEKIKIISEDKSDLIHRFPIVTKFLGKDYNYCLSYYYKKNSDEIKSLPPLEEDYQFIGLRIYFKNTAAVLSFLNTTIFSYYNEFNDYRSKWRSRFLRTLTEKTTLSINSSGNQNEKITIAYHLPQPMYYAFHSTESLWNLLTILAKGYVRNSFGADEEDLIIKLLRIIYHRSTHRRTTTTINGREQLEEKDISSVEKNNAFIKNLINRTADNKLLLYKLIIGLDGEQFKTYTSFIWRIWKNSSFAIIDPEHNKEVQITEKSSVFIDYRSSKKLGFHTDNASIDWKGKQPLIQIEASTKTGTKEVPETFNIGDTKPIYIYI